MCEVYVKIFLTGLQTNPMTFGIHCWKWRCLLLALSYSPVDRCVLSSLKSPNFTWVGIGWCFYSLRSNAINVAVWVLFLWPIVMGHLHSLNACLAQGQRLRAFTQTTGFSCRLKRSHAPPTSNLKMAGKEIAALIILCCCEMASIRAFSLVFNYTFWQPIISDVRLPSALYWYRISL